MELFFFYLMSTSYSNTKNNFQLDNSFEYQEPEKIKGAGNFRKLMKIILISAIVLATVSGIIVLAVVLNKKSHSEDNGNHINYIDRNTTNSQNVTLKTDDVDEIINAEEPTETSIKYNSTINTGKNNSNENKESKEDYVEENKTIKIDVNNSEIYIEQQNEINVTDIKTLEIDKDDNSNYIEETHNINKSNLKINTEIDSTYINEVKESKIIDNSITEKYNDEKSTNYIEKNENLNISTLETINDFNSIYIEKDNESEIINNSTTEINNEINSIYTTIINNSNIEANNDITSTYIAENIESEIINNSNREANNDITLTNIEENSESEILNISNIETNNGFISTYIEENSKSEIINNSNRESNNDITSIRMKEKTESEIINNSTMEANNDITSNYIEKTTESEIINNSNIETNNDITTSNYIEKITESKIINNSNIETNNDISSTDIEENTESKIINNSNVEANNDITSNYIEENAESEIVNNSTMETNNDIRSIYTDENSKSEKISSSTMETNYDISSANIEGNTESQIINSSTMEIGNANTSTDIEENTESETMSNTNIETNNDIDSTDIEENTESEIINNSTIEKDNDDIYVKPKETNIEYNEAELKFFNIEKNISSKIIGESNETQENVTFNYISVLGIKNENEEENTNKTYYEGFFAILSTSYFNKSNNEEEFVLNNIELNKIINEDNQNKLTRNLEEQYFKSKENDEMDDEDYHETMPFLKISFYKDGTYKNIKRPYNLSENNYKEMKEFLDLIIPKISNDSIFVKKIDQETIEKVREDIQISNSLNYDNDLRNLNEKKELNYIKILRKIDELNNNGYKIKINNSNDSYYIDNDFEHYSYMGEHDEENNITNLNCIDNYEDNLTKLNSYQHSGVYSEFTEYRGSNMTKNISTIIDESNGLVKEIFSTTYINLSKQEFLSQTDKDIYNEDNQIKEDNLIYANIDINNTNETNNNTEQNKEDNYDAIYDFKDARSMITVISHHIIINISYYDGKAIENIYNKYLNNFTYEENNSTLRILNRLKRVLSLNDLDKYEIIEGNNFRTLKEYRGERFYGLKILSHRKNVFQTDILGLDISLGLANTYYPSTGQSYYSFKLDIGDYKISRNIKSFQTNQHIIIENTQQMSYKLLKMIYSTHINLEKQNIINYNKINPIFKNILDAFNINIVANNLFSNSQNLYLKFSINKEQYQIYIDDLLNSIELINNNLTHSIAPINSTANILQNYLNNFINNATDEINIKLYDIEKAILDINIEIKSNEDIDSFLYLYEDYHSLIEKIKRYLNYSPNKYIESELKKGKILFISNKDNKINEIMNLNKINIMINSIENKIFNYIFSNEEKNLFSSYLKEFKNLIETNNISSSFDSLTYIFQNTKKNKIISSISYLLEETEDYLDIIKENLPEYYDIEEYYEHINKIEDTINDIVTFNIKNYSNNLFNKYNYAYESINNETKNLQRKAFDFGKSMKNYLFEIKSEKDLKEKNIQDTYFENNMFDLYNISNQKVEFFKRKIPKILHHLMKYL